MLMNKNLKEKAIKIQWNYREIKIEWKRKYAHRYIMEKHLWRKLLDDEHIHHKNWIKNDNRIKNLEIISRKEHCKHHAIENGLWKDRKWISPKNKKTKEEIYMIIKLRKKWYLLKEISKELWYSYVTIQKYCNLYFKEILCEKI